MALVADQAAGRAGSLPMSCFASNSNARRSIVIHRQHHQHHAGSLGARLAHLRRGRGEQSRADPSARSAGAYADMDRPTRDRYRKSVEQISRRSGIGELSVAEHCIAAARRAQQQRPDADRAHHVGYYLISGRFRLEKTVGYAPNHPRKDGQAGVPPSSPGLPRDVDRHDRAVRGEPAALRAQQSGLGRDDRPRRAGLDPSGERARREFP